MKQLKINQRCINKETDNINFYFNDINKIPLLSHDEEAELAKKAKKGDVAAIQKLTLHNLRFVVSVAKQYQNKGVSLEDLLNEGNIGLIRAAEKFDESKGFKFISYAVWWIRQSIIQAIIEYGNQVRLPVNKVRNSNKVNAFFEKFFKENQREPSVLELQEFINDEEIDVRQAFLYGNKSSCIDENINNEEESMTYLDVLTDDYYEADREINNDYFIKDIKKSMKNLNNRQREILCMFFGLFEYDRKTLEEIGKVMSLTRERVRQIKDEAIRVIRLHDTSSNLKKYLK
jgi:RNA polymerase primary sigma factor